LSFFIGWRGWGEMVGDGEQTRQNPKPDCTLLGVGRDETN
jgi:hypothetical protein